MAASGDRLSVSVNLPMSFVDANYTITASLLGYYVFSNGNYMSLSTYAFSKTQYFVQFTCAEKITSVKVYFIAIGKWK